MTWLLPKATPGDIGFPLLEMKIKPILEMKIKPKIIYTRDKLIHSDLDNIRTLLVRCQVFEPFEIEWVVEMMRQTLFDQNIDYHWIIFGDAEGVVAFSCYGEILKERPGRYDFYWFAVDPVLQGQGIGTQLIMVTKSFALTKGAEWAYIETADSNVSAKSLYEKCGFREMGRLESYYGEGRDKLIYGGRL